MPRVKRNPAKKPEKPMPRGFYLKKGIWYKRIYRPHPETGVWGLWAESTGCKESEREAAIEYVTKREADLKKSFQIRQTIDPGKLTVSELLDGLLASISHEPTRRNCEWVVESVLRPYFGQMLASELTVEHCRAFRAYRRKQKNRYGQPISHTTINRDLSKISKAFKVAKELGKIHSLPPGGCAFHKRPEKENTRRVRLPDQYYAFSRCTTSRAAVYICGCL